MADIRQKATPNSYPGIGPVSLVTSYQELTQEEYAVWIRLHVAEESELAAGRRSIALMLEYSERRCNEVLRALNLKGYIAFDTKPGKPTRILISRRAQINARTHFARLSNTLHSNLEQGSSRPNSPISPIIFRHIGKDIFGVSVGLTHPSVGLTHPFSRIYSGPQSDLLNQPAAGNVDFSENVMAEGASGDGNELCQPKRRRNANAYCAKKWVYVICNVLLIGEFRLFNIGNNPIGSKSTEGRRELAFVLNYKFRQSAAFTPGA